MRSKVAIVVILLWWAPVGLAAQITRSTTATIKSCALADSLLGWHSDISGHVHLIAPPDSSIHFSTSPRPFMRGATGVVEVGGSLTFLPGDVALPPFQLELKVISPHSRPLPERQLVLLLDDTLSVDAGSMTAALQHWPGVTDAVENMIISLPFFRLTQIGQAKHVRGRLGSTAFAFSRGQLTNLRTLLVAGLCHEAIPPQS